MEAALAKKRAREAFAVSGQYVLPPTVPSVKRARHDDPLDRKKKAGLAPKKTKQIWHPTSPRMKEFLFEYYSEYARMLYAPGNQAEVQRLLRYYKLDNRYGDSKETALTSFAGGSWRLPELHQDEYFKTMATDLDHDLVLTFNERALGTYSTLCLELDWRFETLAEVLDEADLMAVVQQVHLQVTAYFPTVQALHALVLTAQPKPKFKDAHYMVAQGVHIVYPVRVTVAEGAQITHTVAQAVGRKLVDSLYVNASSDSTPRYVGQPSLRPLGSGKVVPCVYCNDPHEKLRMDESRTARKSFLEYRKTQAPPQGCTACGGHQRVIDGNVYTLHTVLNYAGEVDAEQVAHYRKDRSALLRAASIFSASNPRVQPQTPSHIEKFDLEDMAAPRVTRGVDGLPRPARVESDRNYHWKEEKKALGNSKKGTMKTMLIEECGVNRKVLAVRRGVDWRFAVPLTDRLHTLIREELAFISHRKNVQPPRSEYRLPLRRAHFLPGGGDTGHVGANCLLDKIFMYGGVAVLVTLKTGTPGARFCLRKGKYHSSNRAKILFVDDNTNNQRIYASCFSDHCTRQGLVLIKPGQRQRVSNIVRACMTIMQPALTKQRQQSTHKKKTY